MNTIDETDEKLLSKIKTVHDKKTPQFALNIKNKLGFIIKHTAKDVEYHVESFREKNQGF